MEKANLTHQIIGAAYEVHNVFGFGFLEKVYENAMIIELKERGLYVESQSPLQVYYKDRLVGDYFADLLVENEVIVEIKSVTAICPEHEVQLVNYLNATGKEFGLLININFGISVEVKRNIEHIKPKDSLLLQNPQYTANRYTANRYTVNRYTVNRYTVNR